MNVSIEHGCPPLPAIDHSKQTTPKWKKSEFEQDAFYGQGPCV